MKGVRINHSVIKPHGGLDWRTASEAAGTKVEDRNKWLTIIQNEGQAGAER
jgi:hypothetical protein